jgi:hypothetical protein
MRRDFNVALLDLQEGNYFPEEEKLTLLIEDILQKPLRELQDAYSSGPALGNGPYGAWWYLAWEKVIELRAAAVAAVEAREAKTKADRMASKVARHTFQVRVLDFLGGSVADKERASRGFFPPDELLHDVLLPALFTSAEVMDVGYVVRDNVSLDADRFGRLRQLEEELEVTRGRQKSLGIKVTLQTAEAIDCRAYDDDPTIPVLLVIIEDVSGESDWIRQCPVSLAPPAAIRSMRNPMVFFNAIDPDHQ